MAWSGYLVTIEGGLKARDVVWDTHHPLHLDHPSRWELVKTPEGLIIREISKQGSSMRVFPVGEQAFNRAILLPKSDANAPKVRVRIKPLAQPAAVYETKANIQAARWDRVLYMGLSKSLLSHRSFGKTFRIHLEGRQIFGYSQEYDAHSLTAGVKGVTIEYSNGTKRELRPGQPEAISHNEFCDGTIRWKKHWWKVAYIPDPQKIAKDIERTAETAKGSEGSLKAYMVASAIFLIVLGLVAPSGQEPKKKIIAETKIELKAPKIIEELKKPTPPPVVAKVVPPKPKPKPRPVEVAKVEKKAPKGGGNKKPLKMAQKAAPKKAPPPPVRVARTEPPAPAPRITAAEIAAQQAMVRQQQAAVAAARVKAQQKAQLANALGFLTTSASRPAAPQMDDVIAENSKQELSNRYNTVAANTTTLAKGATYLSSLGDKNSGKTIVTRGSRSMAVEYGMGDGRSEGAGTVQARVDAGALGGGDGEGSGLGNSLGSGLDITGTGSVDKIAIEKALEKHLARFQYCYEKVLLSDSSLAGTILLQWTIKGNGKGGGVQVVRSQLNNNTLHNCLSTEVARIQFPTPSGGAVIVKYPFAFSSGTL